jgi:hypothetical protein
MRMALADTITIPGKKQGRIGRWMVQNDSRIKDLRHSLHLFRKSPLAVIGLIIVLLFVLVLSWPRT